MSQRRINTCGILLAGALIMGCGSGQIPSILRIDTPVYHVSTGNRLLEIYKTESALREFQLALELDPAYSPAFVGLGLAHASRGDWRTGMDALDLADRFARGKDQEVSALVGYIRLYTAGGEQIAQDWLGKAESAFSRAILIADEIPDPYYYMGLAFKAAGNTNQAAKLFYRVLEMDKGLVREADLEYAAIEKRR